MAISDELKVRMTGDASSLKKASKEASQSLSGLQNIGKSVSKELAGMVAKYATIGVAIAGVGKAISASTKQFASYEQNVGGAKAVFGDFSNYLIKKSEEASSAVGMSMNDYLQGANKIGAIMQGAGIAQGKSLEMTTAWMERASDMASVMGESTETALTAVTAAAKGNFTLMDNIGVKMSATTLEAYALSKGIQQSFADMDEATKVGLAYQMFMEKTTQYAGNFRREGAETLQGSLAVLSASFKNLGTYLGQAFAPIIMTVANFMTGYIIPAVQAVIPYIVGFMQVVGKMVSFVAKALGGLFGGIGGKKGGQELAQATDGAGKAMGKVAGGANDTAGGLKNANKEAKKLKGQLASFDEMNVLAEPQNGGGGADVGGGGGIADIPTPDISGLTNYESGLDKVKKKADDVANSISKSFKKLGESISKSISPKSFESFRVGVEAMMAPLAESVGRIWSGLSTQVSEMWARSGERITEGWGITVNSLLEGIGRIGLSMGGLFETIMPNIELGVLSISGLFLGIFEQWQLTMAEWSPIIIESLTTLITSIIDEGLKPTLGLLTQAWGEAWSDVKKIWDKYGGQITNGIAEAFNNIVKIFQKIWDDIISPIWTPFMEQLKKTWEDTLRPMLKTIHEFVAKLIVASLEIFNKFISPIIKWLIDVLKPAIVGVANFITGTIDTFLRFFGGVINGIFGFLGGLVDFIAGVFTGNWGKAWEGVKGMLKGIVDTFSAIVKAPINFIIDIINGFIAGLNTIKIPDWVPVVGGKGINIPRIPKLATGGIATKATPAIIGEAGREAILPLENNTGWMDKLADKINGGSSGDSTPATIIVKIGEETIIEKVIEGINGRTSLSGRNAIII